MPTRTPRPTPTPQPAGFFDPSRSAYRILGYTHSFTYEDQGDIIVAPIVFDRTAGTKRAISWDYVGAGSYVSDITIRVRLMDRTVLLEVVGVERGKECPFDVTFERVPGNLSAEIDVDVVSGTRPWQLRVAVR